MFLPQFFYRVLTRVSPWRTWQLLRLWIIPSLRSLQSYRTRRHNGVLFPPFFFIALTDACNLRCHGCWITRQGQPRELSLEDLTRFIRAAVAQGNRFFVLLGGEPLLYKDLVQLVEAHPDCYFQIITNGMLFQPEDFDRFGKLGNITFLVSVDGFQETNDLRRGSGVFGEVCQGLRLLRKMKIPFGIATTITSRNATEVLSRSFIDWVDRHGALYLWYYIYRPVGSDPTPELALSREQMIGVRKRLVDLRRKSPILLIDTYWDEDGRAVCPAALGLGYHIGPAGDIELCPPLSFATATIRDNGGEVFQTINNNQLLRSFQKFALERTRGCVILERPQELAEFLRNHGARDTSGRDAYSELGRLTPRPSHHLPELEIPEKTRIYRWLKRRLFFGLGAYG